MTVQKSEKIIVRDSFLNENKTVCRAFTDTAGRSNAAAVLWFYRYGHGYRVRVVERGRVWWCRHPRGHRVTVVREPCKRVAGHLPHILPGYC